MKRRSKSRLPLRKDSGLLYFARNDEFGAVPHQHGMATISSWIFVDQIFTTSIQSAFTKAFAVNAETSAAACLCRARNGD
jgi:hypothetical protein